MTGSSSRPSKPSMPKSQSRPRIAAMETGPGPAAYALPSTIGNGNDLTKKHSPIYSFGLRHRHKDTNVAHPGPAAFYPKATRSGPISSQEYSIQGRAKTSLMNEPDNQSPGPAAYIPPNRPPQEDIAPAWSMGKKLISKPAFASFPSPAKYQIKQFPASALNNPESPSYTMSPKTPLIDSLKGIPGPGSYKAVDPNLYKRSAPGYSLAPRYQSCKEWLSINTDNPGPGTYTPNLARCLPSAPAFSMRVRHSEYTMPVLHEKELKDDPLDFDFVEV